jgi:hypothetical protein
VVETFNISTLADVTANNSEDEGLSLTCKILP